MARSSQVRRRPQAANLPRPGRTLALFLVVVLAMYALLISLDLTGRGSDTWTPRLGLDLQGGTRISLEAKSDEGSVDPAKLREARSIIDQRVNATGVSEAEVSTQGSNQVVIEIPGQSKGDIVDQVGRTAQLRFRLLWASTQSATKALPDKEVASLTETVDKADWKALSLDQLISAETEGLETLPKDYTDAVTALQQLAAGFVCTPDLTVDDVASQPLVTCDPTTGEVQVLSPAIIEGDQIKSAQPTVDQQSGQFVVSLGLKGPGADVFEKVTSALSPLSSTGSGQTSRFAVVLDGVSITAPRSIATIVDGNSQITGDFTQASATDLANQLKFGALPLTFEVNNVAVEGPSLAGSQLSAGLIAGLVGLALVVVYLLLYYRALGLVAIGSLLVAAATTYAVVLLLGRGLGFTLTLPGIAGLIVAIGITADSFIVFFERLRDEVRDGKTLRSAVETGWVRARTTILAADIVSLLAAVVLFIFAIGVVRGFAFALGLTTLIDIAVVFGFTKPVMSMLARTKFFGQGHKLSGLDADHLGIAGRRVDVAGRRPTASAASTQDADADAASAGSVHTSGGASS